MKDPNTRNPILYLIGILALVTIMFFVIMRISDNGIDIITGANKTYSQPPEKVIDEAKDYQAIIKTSEGEITVDLLEKNAPVTVNNFVFLSRDGFYDGVSFHRIVKDFIIQSGSRLTLDNNPRNDGVGGPGYRFTDEINWDSIGLDENSKTTLTQQGFKTNNSVQSVKMEKYALAMANAGPETNGSQFFFVSGDPESESIKGLNGKHTVFGRVIAGQEVIDKINNAELGTGLDAERPVNPIKIEEIEIIEKS